MKKKVYTLKEIPVWPVVFTSALFLAGLIGLVGCLVILTNLPRGWKAFGDAFLGTFFGVFILAPVYGMVVGILVALFNWAARISGGFKFFWEIDE